MNELELAMLDEKYPNVVDFIKDILKTSGIDDKEAIDYVIGNELYNCDLIETDKPSELIQCYTNEYRKININKIPELIEDKDIYTACYKYDDFPIITELCAYAKSKTSSYLEYYTYSDLAEWVTDYLNKEYNAELIEDQIVNVDDEEIIYYSEANSCEFTSGRGYMGIDCPYWRDMGYEISYNKILPNLDTEELMESEDFTLKEVINNPSKAVEDYIDKLVEIGAENYMDSLENEYGNEYGEVAYSDWSIEEYRYVPDMINYQNQLSKEEAEKLMKTLEKKLEEEGEIDIIYNWEFLVTKKE